MGSADVMKGALHNHASFHAHERQRTSAVALQNFTGVTVEARTRRCNFYAVIEQVPEWLRGGEPATYVLRRQFDNHDRGSQARSFGINQHPRLIFACLKVLRFAFLNYYLRIVTKTPKV